MDKTKLVAEIVELFRISGHKVETSVKINHREIDIRAQEQHGLVRKIILIECADYQDPVGVGKIQDDLAKLKSAKESLKDGAVLMHVARNGYSPDASGYAFDANIEIRSLADLRKNLINFDEYIAAVSTDSSRDLILKEYQPNNISFESKIETKKPSIEFLDNWLNSNHRWLTLLGDYGVGKSWTLKRYLYHLMDKYIKLPSESPLPFFIPLQRFTKAFSFQNLILATLQMYGVSGVFYSAFEYLMNSGRIVFLFDSFDEMAQHLNRETIRENLKELLSGLSSKSRAIMTSRPNYFEGRAEKILLVERDGRPEWHQLDVEQNSTAAATSRIISNHLSDGQFARIADLTIEQRKRLFEIVLGKNTPSHKALLQLFSRFQNLGSISQRAVIARLLTSVATSLADPDSLVNIEGTPILPEDIKTLNEAKIFEIVVHTLLGRDQGIGVLTNTQRLYFLREFAAYLQQQGRDSFATPEELKQLVGELFKNEIQRSDRPAETLENYYRTCRRHSGLTTEGQFRDTTGQVDTPVEDDDLEARVGFSHNSLREYLVADALIGQFKFGKTIQALRTVIVSDAVSDFVRGMTEFDNKLPTILSDHYKTAEDPLLRERIFFLIYGLIRNSPSHLILLGSPPVFIGVDLSGLDLSALDLNSAKFEDCIAQDTDFRKSDLRKSIFLRTSLQEIALDGAIVLEADFRQADLISLYAFDEYDSRTTSVLGESASRQWLFSRGAHVSPTDDLNPHLGQPWYEAAREVTQTLVRRMGGTHQDISLAKGTKSENRQFATDFVKFLVKKHILVQVTRSKNGPGYVLKVHKDHRDLISDFSKSGKISPLIEEFFKEKLQGEERQ